MISKSDRNCHVGLHVTQNVRSALGQEARKRSVSMSMLIYMILEKELLSLGYDIYGKVRSDNEVPLPFEDPS